MPKSKTVSVIEVTKKPLSEVTETTTRMDIPILEESYPFWRIIVWRYVRVFIAGFVAALSVDMFISGNPDIIVSAIKSAIAGGLAALSLALREDKPKDAVINKLPL